VSRVLTLGVGVAVVGSSEWGRVGGYCSLLFLAGFLVIYFIYSDFVPTCFVDLL